MTYMVNTRFGNVDLSEHAAYIYAYSKAGHEPEDTKGAIASKSIYHKTWDNKKISLEQYMDAFVNHEAMLTIPVVYDSKRNFYVPHTDFSYSDCSVVGFIAIEIQTGLSAVKDFDCEDYVEALTALMSAIYDDLYRVIPF